MSAKTKLCCLIGHPVAHSLSPVMHNTAFRLLGIDYVYVCFDVKPGMLRAAFNGIKALGVRGANVTIPHKEEAARLVDELDDVARLSLAVNTVLNKEGFLVGFNTDGPAAVKCMLRGGVKPDGMQITVVGAGGASRAILASILNGFEVAGVSILNRTYERARNLALYLLNVFGQDLRVKAFPLTPQHLKREVSKADLVVNATSIGMFPRVDETPIPTDFLQPGQVVFDVVYNPPKTALLRGAEKRGCKTISGLDMFVEQGALAFKIWTGLEPPVREMRRAVVEALKRGDW